MWQTPHLKSLRRSFKILDASVVNFTSRSLKRGSIMPASRVHDLKNFKARICAFNIYPAFQLSDVSQMLGWHSGPYFLSLQSMVNSASARFASRVHGFKSTSVFLNSYFLSLQKFNPLVFSFLQVVAISLVLIPVPLPRLSR